jgi:hypothetical protein
MNYYFLLNRIINANHNQNKIFDIAIGYLKKNDLFLEKISSLAIRAIQTLACGEILN